MANETKQKAPRRYEKMRDSGVEWIGMVPEHWNVERLQWHLEEINHTNNPVKTANILSLTNKLGVVPYKEKGNQGNKAKENLSDYKLAYPNCIVANSMNILIGSVGLCNYFGCVSPVYYVFKAKDLNDIRFFNYVFGLTNFQKELRKYANGILEIRLRVSASNILKRRVAIPPYSEQLSIADFLDNIISKIDSIIAEAKASIEEYKAWKSSIIYEAVTKGLDPTAEMKDSGVEWIGKIPVAWSACALKRLTVKIGSGKTPLGGAETYTSHGVLFLRSQNIYDTGLQLNNATYISPEVNASMKNTEVEFGDVLLNITGGSIGRCCVYDLDGVVANVNQHVCIIRTKQEILRPQYLRYFWNSAAGPMVISQCQTGGNRPGLNFEQIGSVKIPLCDIASQDAIIKYLDSKTRDIDSLIQQKQSLISDLESYKKSLIYEVVTGKRKVV